MAKKKSAETCPECKGPKRGRGYEHKATCSKKTSASSGGTGGKFKMTMLRGYSAQELLEVRKKIDGLIAERRAEVVADRKAADDLLKEIDSLKGK